jgi:hypothetical protein
MSLSRTHRLVPRKSCHVAGSLRTGNLNAQAARHAFQLVIYVSFLLGPLLFLSAAGCRQKNRLSVYPVHGRVMYGTRGIPEATVIFFRADDAVEKAKKLRPFGYCDGQGNFDLKTYVDDDGAPPGKYRVAIIAFSAARSSSGKDRPAGERPAGQTNLVQIPAEVSKKYGNVETAGIEVTINKGENNLEPFVLSMNTARGPQADAGTASSVSSKN